MLRVRCDFERPPGLRQLKTLLLLIKTKNAPGARGLKNREAVQPDGSESQNNRGRSQVRFDNFTRGDADTQGLENCALLVGNRIGQRVQIVSGSNYKLRVTARGTKPDLAKLVAAPPLTFATIRAFQATNFIVRHDTLAKPNLIRTGTN